VVIGLDLDHAATDTADTQNGPDQLRRDLVHTAAKESTA
jgi:hypothetical protein